MVIRMRRDTPMKHFEEGCHIVPVRGFHYVYGPKACSAGSYLGKCLLHHLSILNLSSPPGGDFSLPGISQFL